MKQHNKFSEKNQSFNILTLWAEQQQYHVAHDYYAPANTEKIIFDTSVDAA